MSTHILEASKYLLTAQHLISLFCLQDSVLFHDTIFYNLHYGNLLKNEEDVYAATKMAELHDSIQQWPQGYQTPVGFTVQVG